MSKNEYTKQEIEALLSLSKVNVIEDEPEAQGNNDLKNYGGENIRLLALVESENYKETRKSYHDPYANKDYDINTFCPLSIAGTKQLQYDHIISLQKIWNRGGFKWPEEKKIEFVFDLSAGVVTSSAINEGKSDKDLAEFLNSNLAPQIDKRAFCLSYLVIAVRYEIPLTRAEFNEIESKLTAGKFPVKVINPLKS